MSDIEREESGRFFFLPDKKNFTPEDVYKGKAYEGISHIDFVCLRGNKLHYIEVKSSFPQPGNADNFDDKIAEIVKKFICSTLLHCSVKFKKNENKEWPSELIKEKTYSRKTMFVLILTGEAFKQEALAPIKNKISIAMRPYLRAIGKSQIAVWNPTLAKKYGFNSKEK